MSTVHLSVVELERYGEFISKPSLSVSSPNHKGIIENPAIHANSPVNLGIYNGRCANNHTFIRQVLVCATFSNLQCVFHILLTKHFDVVGEEDVTRRDLALFVPDDGIDRKAVVLHQLVADRQEIELFDGRSGFADTPVQQHVELVSLLLAYSYQARNINRLEECDHRVGSLHPQLKGLGTAGVFWIYFTHRFRFIFIDSVLIILFGSGRASASLVSLGLM